MSAQFHDTNQISDKSEGQKKFSTFLKYFVDFCLCFVLIHALGIKEYITAGLYLIVLIAYHKLIHKFIWDISNKIRLWVMPETFLAVSATDALKKKIFWNVGPQWFGALITLFILISIVDSINPTIGVFRETSQSKERKEKFISDNKKHHQQEMEKLNVPNSMQGKWELVGSVATCESNPLIISSNAIQVGNNKDPLQRDSQTSMILVSSGNVRFEPNSDGTLTYIASGIKKGILKKCP